MRRFFLILSLYVLLFSACGKDSAGVHLATLEQKHKSETVSPSSAFNPRAMFIAAGSLVFFSDAAPAPLAVMSLPLTGEVKFEGSTGRGPGELLFPDLKSIEGTQDGFVVFDSDGKKKTYKKNSDAAFYCDQTTEYDLGTDPPNGIRQLKSGLLNVSLDEKFEYVLRDASGEIKHICPYPELPIDENEFKPMHFLKSIAVHPAGDRFMAFYSFEPLMRCISSSGEILFEKNIPLAGVRNERLQKDMYYSGTIMANEEALIVKYGNDEIHVFDWNGRMMKRVQLDHVFSLFTYDFSNDTLFALDTESETPYILVYNAFLS